jgi:hypothetical protein
MQWGTGYALAALLCLIPSILYCPQLLYFGIPLVLLLLVNIWHSKIRAEREILNDLCAILIFSLGGAAAYLFGGGQWDKTMAVVVLFSFLYFTGSALFVKTVFRERTSKRWLMYAKIYHGLVLLVPLAVGYPLMAIAYLFASIRAFVYAGKAMRPMKVGMIEIIGVVLFLVFSVVFLN